MKLSVVIISYNEEKHIRKCLDSVQSIADEIIVVDSYSTDNTPDICQEYSVNFCQKTYSGQIEQKLFAKGLAQHEVMLSLDADEAIDDELQAEIQKEKQHGFPFDGYFLNRKAFYCGHWINHGDWSSEWKVRLWKKDAADWKGPNPHDKVYLHASGISKRLSGSIHHYTFDTPEEHKKQIQNYALISAQSYQKQQRKFPALRMLFSPLTLLLKSYILKGGFLDGKIGWQLARLGMSEKYLKYKVQKRLKEN